MTLAIDLSGRAALVVGGAGGGIGTAMATTIARARASVGIITNVADHAADSVALIRDLGVPAASAVCDVTDEAALVEAIASIATELGPLRHAVNVVGGNMGDEWHRAREYDMATFDRVMARNLRYAVVSCREVASALVASGQSGSIVNISSLAARGTPLLAAYSAAKAGLESFSRTMALEWGQYGIRVNLVAPGTVKTPRAGQSDLADAAASIPLGRRGTPADIANAAAFLLSDLASYITGQIVLVDGGSGMGSGGETLPAFLTNPIARARFS